MNVYLNKVTGYASAITSMYQSKRSWTRELEVEMYNLEDMCTTNRGRVRHPLTDALLHVERQSVDRFNAEIDKLCKHGREHITLLRFINMEFSVEGLHRGGQDDFDAHAKRLDNRIVRSSTRLSEFGGSEKSDYYKDKILTLEEVLDALDIELPDKIFRGGSEFVRAENGYIRADEKDNKDVKRGLYTLSIPSNFTVQCNLTEFSHIYKLRNVESTANPEVQTMIEALASQLETKCRQFNRVLLREIKN